MTRVLASVCLAVGVWASACTPGGGSSSSGGNDGYGSVRDFYVAIWAKFCDLDERCAATHGLAFSSKAACNAYLNDLDNSYRMWIGAGLFETFERIYKLGSAADQDACLSLYGSMSCDAELPDDNACERALQPRNPVGVGGVCGADLESDSVCDNDLYCATDEGGSCRHCATLKASGAACQGSQECTSDFCEQTCKDRPAAKAKGAACTSSDRCVGNLECGGPSGNTTCQEQGGLNANCENVGCYDDLYCDDDEGGSNTCKAYPAAGATCDRAGTVQCRFVCVFPAADAASGTCGMPNPMPGHGQPCAGQGWCADGTHPTFTLDNGAVTACVCETDKAQGADCVNSSECESGVCGSDQKCGPKVANGGDCYWAEQCQSDYCDSSTWKCAAKPVCN